MAGAKRRRARVRVRVQGNHCHIATNVLGTDLDVCSTAPMTGFYRNGCCDTGPEDGGVHVVCAVMTDDFLTFTAAQGNDLSTPRPAYGFPGLAAGDQWCLCAARWNEALDAGVAPPVRLEATHARVLDWVDRADLEAHAVEGDAPTAGS